VLLEAQRVLGGRSPDGDVVRGVPDRGDTRTCTPALGRAGQRALVALARWDRPLPRITVVEPPAPAAAL